MNNILNASPRVNILGIQDLSGQPPVYEATPTPTHLPLFYLYTEKGPENEPQLVSGDAIDAVFGSKTFDARSPYYNHQTVIADLVRARQAVQIQRVCPDDMGPAARLLLSLDIVPELIPQYERNSDGSFRRDAQGQKIETGETVAGYRAKWVANQWNTGEDAPFGQVDQSVGSLISSTEEQSTIYPILELEVSSRGAHGNNLGIRFSAPTTESASPINDDLVSRLNAYLYRIQFVTRNDAMSSGRAIESNMGEQFIDFTFKEGQVDTATDTLVSIEDTLIQAFEQVGQPGMPNVYGPFRRLKVYQDNLEAVLSMVGEAEVGQGLLPVTEINDENLHLVNVFTATTHEGVPYSALELVGPTEGGLYLNENATHYAAGGSDGTMNLEAFDAKVRDMLTAWGDPGNPLLDWARYPMSCLYDSGFSLETKKALLIPMSKRSDVWVTLSTQDVLQPQNSPAEDSSMAIALRSAAEAYPESVLYGTKVCRVIIVGQSGHLINHRYKGLMPLTAEFAARVADYMGAGNGRWNENVAFDRSPNNLVTMFRDVNNTHKPANARKNDWDNGLVWAQYYDHRSLFFPAFQTAYSDDSSVLNSAINMMVAVEGIKAAQRSWRDITGVSDKTPAQVIEAVNAAVAADLDAGRFGGRFTIVPETYLSSKDEQRGYSYSCKIHIYAPNMITVGSYTIPMHRRGDLDQQGA